MLKRVFFYGFRVPRHFSAKVPVTCRHQNVRSGSKTTTKFSQVFSVCNSKNNCVQQKKHLMLFIADEDDGSGRVNGRLVKIRQGKAKRVNVDIGEEWLEELIRSNGIEDETFVTIFLNEGVMVAEFNGSAFKILSEANATYFDNVLKVNNTVLKPLALPDWYRRLVDSKRLDGYRFNIDDNDRRVSELVFGQSYGGWMKKHLGRQNQGGKVRMTLEVRFTAEEQNMSEEELNNAKKAVAEDKKKGRMKQADIITENGIFSLISPTFINETIEFDEESDEIQNEIFDQMEFAYNKRKNDIEKAATIEMPEDNQRDLDFFLDN